MRQYENEAIRQWENVMMGNDNDTIQRCDDMRWDLIRHADGTCPVLVSGTCAELVSAGQHLYLKSQTLDVDLTP